MYLLAQIVDLIAGGNWQRGGGKGRRPRPVERPGHNARRHFGRARPLSEVRHILDHWGEARDKTETVLS